MLDGHKDGVLSLSYSPDGKLLASGSIDDTAIVWSLASGKALLQVHGDSGDINAVRFSRSGKNLVTAGDDKTVRVWRLKDGRQIAKLVGHTDVVSGLAVPVTGGTAFSASIDHTLRALDDETGKDLGGFVDVGSVVTALAVSPDGTRVVSGDGAQPYKAHFLDASTGDELVSYGRLDSVISAAAFNADGSLVALAGGVNNEIHVVKVATGERITKLGGIGQSVFSVGFGKDGHSIAWGFTEQSHEPNARGPLEFQMRLPNAGQPLADPRGIGPVQDFVGARAKLGKLHLERRAGGLFRYFALLDLIDGKKPVATIERTQDDGYAHDSFTFLGKADAILSGGGHGFLTAFGRDGTKLRDYVGHTSNVWSVVASPDGKLVLSGSDDQTVRLWNAKTAENIVSMFLGTGGEWVMWTPDGYYAASPEGDQHVGWQINAGFDRSARFISAAQLKRHFYQPDLVRDAIALGSAKAAIAKAHLPPFDLAELANRQPPEFHFLGLNDGDQAATSPLKIALEIDPATDPAETVTALVNGRQVVSDALDLVSGRQRHVLELPLGKGDNEIVVTVANAVGSTEHKTTVRYNGKGELDTRGTLYVIAIGVDEYTELHQNLEYAGADAEAFAKTVAAKAGPLHQRVESVVLSANGDQKPTSVNLRKAFDMLKAAKANDTIVIFSRGPRGERRPRLSVPALRRDARRHGLAARHRHKVADPAKTDRDDEGPPDHAGRHLPLRQRLQRPAG